jgi:hypothetical protein
MYDCLSYSLVRIIIALLLALLLDSHIVPCIHIVIHICLDMNVHLLYDIHLIIGCMSYPVSDEYSDDEYG